MKNKLFLLLLILLAYTTNSISQSTYTPLTNEEIKVLIPSETRIVSSLAGSWQRIDDNGNTSRIILPYSERDISSITYQKDIKISKNLLNSHSFQIYFLGVESHVEIYINGQFIGKFLGGGTPFYVTIPTKMVAGENNLLKLVITEAETQAKLIKENTLFAKKTYLGMIREAFLIATPKVWISDLKYSTLGNNSSTKIKIKSKISASGLDLTNHKTDDSAGIGNLGKVSINVQAFLFNKITKSLVGESSLKSYTIENERTILDESNIDLISPQLWSPENPNLYELKIKVTKGDTKLDEFGTDLGVRNFKILNIDGKNKLLLNDQAFEIKGVSYIEHYGSGNQTLSTKRMEDDVKSLKTLGANLVRVKFGSPHPYFVHLCNRYGLFVIIELPLYDVPAKVLGSDEVQVLMTNLGERYISAYENFPSVLAWGIISGSDEMAVQTLKYNNKITSFFKNSSSKLLYKIVNFGSQDFDFKNIDLIGIQNNEKLHSFDEVKSEISRLTLLTKNKPVFLSFGVTIQPQNNNGYADRLSVEYQAHYIRNILLLAKERDLIGSIYNCFNDYELNSPLLLANNENPYLASNGLLNINRQERLSYKTLQTLFNNEKEPLLNAGSYSEKTPIVYIVVGVLIVILMGGMFNRFRRFREYFTRSLLRPYNFYADIRDQRIISSSQTFALGLSISLTMGLFFSSILFYYRTSEISNYWLRLLFPSVNIQEILFSLVWRPEALLISLAMIFFLLQFLVAAIIRVFSIFVRLRISYRDTLTITVWSGVPFLLILPVAMLIMKLLAISEIFTSILLFASLMIIIWGILRMLKATSVVFDKPVARVNVIGFLFLLATLGIPLAYYQIKYSFLDYGEFIFKVLMKI
ncbi:MAG: hypothetical protein NTW25_04330 [Candidatus Kapabacteria bacterium]|nr:hypothetical protein [Candidatus Kapabacteria bacterium]